MKCSFSHIGKTKTGKHIFRCRKCNLTLVLSKTPLNDFHSANQPCGMIVQQKKKEMEEFAKNREASVEKSREKARKKAATFDARARNLLAANMLASIEAIGTPTDGAIESRLSICQQCDKLQFDGCSVACNCSNRWPKWRGRIIEGRCECFQNTDNTKSN